mmetsp:Transcript_19413/g.22331  ORF Transcript_19413/g.22331 Transcript_19413/m.22331 type:complete len:88 (-) Transcript_19413:155-418(-)
METTINPGGEEGNSGVERGVLLYILVLRSMNQVITQRKKRRRRSDVKTDKEFLGMKFFTSDTFGDASVAIPHKQAIIPYVDVLSDLA